MKTDVFTIQELTYLNELLSSDLPLKTCLTLIEEKRNKKIIASIIKKLSEGKLIEEVILQYLQADIKVYLGGLINKLSFKQSLYLALEFYKRKRNNFQ